MSTVLELTSLINTQLNRGTIYDSAMLGVIAQAGRKLERNYDFQYMRNFRTSVGTADVRSLAVPGSFIKRFDMVRLVRTDGKYTTLTKIDPNEVRANEVGDPKYFWIDARSTLWFDNTPDRAITFEFMLIEMFDWDSLSDSDTSWLISEGQDVLMWETLRILAVADRDKELYTLAKAESVEALRTLLIADEAYRNGSDDATIRYGNNV